MAKYLYDLSQKSVFVAGHNGLVGSAVWRHLRARAACRVLTADRGVLDLEDQAATYRWFRVHRPDVVILAAAYVGGIGANIARPVDFLARNLAIQSHALAAAYEVGVEKFLLLGSSCVYPKDAPEPLCDTALMTGALEPTNAPYALAKLAGIGLCQAYRTQYGCDYISVMPCNVYGIEDCFDVGRCHVIPALIAKVYQAKVSGASAVRVWGTGLGRREFVWNEDLADAVVCAVEGYSDLRPLNIGSGWEITIADLARMIVEISGYDGDIVFESERPDGVLSKRMESSGIRALGWRPVTLLRDGLARVYGAYVRRQQAGGAYTDGA